jgi:hypothetical protein
VARSAASSARSLGGGFADFYPPPGRTLRARGAPAHDVDWDAMAEGAAKRGAGKGARTPQDAPGVLGNLPAARPARIGSARGSRPASARSARAAATAATTPATAPEAPRARRFEASAPAPESPDPVAPEPPPRRAGPPGPAELTATAVQAAGQVAQIGLTMWGQLLKQWMDRLPRP